MRIAVDCDGVLLDTVGHYLKCFFPDYKKEDIIKWEMFEILGISKGEMMRYFKRIDKTKTPFIDGAIKYFNKLAKKYTLNIVTINPKEKREQLEKKFKDLNYYKLILIDPTKFNGKHTLSYNLFIDDHSHFPDSLKSSPYKRLFLFDQPWNRDVNCVDYNNVSRVISWKHIYRLLK